MNENCQDCEKQQYKERYADPHEFLIVDGSSKSFRGGRYGGYDETPYKCTKCNARFIYSDDKNDNGWRLCSRKL